MNTRGIFVLLVIRVLTACICRYSRRILEVLRKNGGADGYGSKTTIFDLSVFKRLQV